MKSLRISALIVAVIMLASCVISCGNGNAASNKVTCTLSVEIKGITVIDSLEVPVESTEDSPATVLKALEIALQYSNYQYECDSTNLKRVVVDGTEYAAGIEGENLWFWNYTANGAEPEKGSPAINLLNNGDVIVFSYTSIPVEVEEEQPEETDEDVEDTSDEAAD